MSESELEEILREVKHRANATATFNNIINNPEPKKEEAEPVKKAPASNPAPAPKPAPKPAPAPKPTPAPKPVEKPQVDKPVERVFVLDDIEDEVKAVDDKPLTLAEDSEPSADAPSIDADPVFDNLFESTPKPAERKEVENEGYLDVLSLVNDGKDADKDESKGKKKKSIIIAVVAIIVVLAVAAGVYFAFGRKEPTPVEPTTVAAPIPEPEIGDWNPLTGETTFNPSAIGQRPVAIVCENEYGTEEVRPQWGIDQADIVLEGESEFSTRLLLFWADYTKVPEMVGPTRSARPPFIQFSQLFDSVFIHAGLSHTEGGYIGADSVFESDKVDHINLLNYQEDGVYIGRNYERDNPAIEHTAFLNGTNLPKLLQEKGFNLKTDYSKFTILSFNDEAKKMGNLEAKSCSFKWSSNCPKIAEFVYDDGTHKYITTDFDSEYGQSNVAFENLIFLLADTEYVVNSEYKDGQGETYCNYNLQRGGTGTILSEGYALQITWGVTDGKLWMKDSSGNDVSLNVGKSYIGYGSSNNGGLVTLNGGELTITTTTEVYTTSYSSGGYIDDYDSDYNDDYNYDDNDEADHDFSDDDDLEYGEYE